MAKDKGEAVEAEPNDLLDEDPGTSEEAPRAEGNRSRVMRMARKLMDRKELAEDTKDLLVSVLATSDKAKSEAVKMVAREVRNYLEALELKEDLLRLMTSYSLEVSVRLKPLADAVREVDEEDARDREK